MPLSTQQKIDRMVELGLNTDPHWHTRGQSMIEMWRSATPAQIDCLYNMLFDH